MPPPWLEFTTSDFSRIATRVKPPGVTLTPLGVVSTNGRRSTCLGAKPLLVRIGTVVKLVKDRTLILVNILGNNLWHQDLEQELRVWLIKPAIWLGSSRSLIKW